MSSTHILIPITDIKEGIDYYENLLKDSNNKFATKHQGHLNQLQTLLKTSKQISLSEVDIELKAKQKYPRVAEYLGMSGDGTKNYGKDFNEPMRNAYKQALKDLL